MKFIHIADLHIGKRVNEFSMIDDQRFVLDQISGIVKSESPDAVLIAGDVYDKALPPAEAVKLFDDFISELAETGTEVMIISGNHDSAERLSFGSRIMDKRGIHFTGGYDGQTHAVTIEDEHGGVCFYMLPFIKPVHVRAAFPDDEEAQGISTFTEAVRFAIDRMDVDTSARNVLIAHQFVTGGERCESEEISVGGLDNVDAEVFGRFDYTALGHLHGPQYVAGNTVRYAGSPLKYSFSEISHRKSVTVVEIGEKGSEPLISTRDLKPLHDLKELKGSFYDLTDKDYLKDADPDDYMHIILTDEEDVIGALQSLRALYPNIMRLDYDNKRTRSSMILTDAGDGDPGTPLEIFGSLYEAQNGKPMDEKQEKFISELIDRVWSEEI